ncbi:MAG: replication restart helicase PriA [Gemmatimonadaceae bacterium]
MTRVETGGTLIEVALPLPLFQTFTYLADDSLAHPVIVGSRVVVPFRQKRQIGICVAVGASAKPGTRIKKVLEAPDPEPVAASDMVALCNWIADYYVAPPGVALRLALPVLLTGADAPRPKPRTRRILRIKGETPTLIERDTIFGRAKQQRALFEAIESLGGASTAEHLRDQLGFSAAVITALEKRGLVLAEEEVVARDPFLSRKILRSAPLSPTAAQRAAIDDISAASGAETFLLHGVTGSGKTLVYIEVLRAVLERGKSAIVLVPEIALTPQTVDRFRGAFGDAVAVLHSALSDGERYDAWLALKRGDKRIAVGARSAVFAPVSELGAIIVDEEHEASYKQGEAPRYHAREVAIMRAHAAGAVVVLGSATPSLESWVNAEAGKYRLLRLPERVAGGKLPKVEIVNLRHRFTGGNGSGPPPATDYERTIGAELDEALHARLARKEQSILLLNRRGYASFIQCDECGYVESCPNCSITLTHHRTPERLICHYCLHHEEPASKCGRCGGTTLRQRGVGTQRVERLLGERFPGAGIARMDVDTTSGKWAHVEILDRVASGEVDILLGTQMIAKGLDFANVTLVGVVDADVGINLPDFRASERCFQLLSQVAGRAGRGPKGGSVIIQTRVPEHHAVVHALTHDYEAFVVAEIEGRRQPAYPPFVRLANIVFSAVEENAAMELAVSAGEWMSQLLVAGQVEGITLVGPAPCPIERIKNRFRWHLLLKSSQPGTLTRALRFFAERYDPAMATAQRRITIDRDPVSLL